MGNILLLSSSKDNPKDDEKWLKMPANELFNLEVSENKYMIFIGHKSVLNLHYCDIDLNF